MIVWVTKSECWEFGRSKDEDPSLHRTKAAAVQAAKSLMGADDDIRTEVVKVSFPEGNKDKFIKVLRWVLEDHDTNAHIGNETPGTIVFKEIK